jgi:CRISPR/Cas system-associated exonuclease Cas4 (RecB family)
MIAQTLAAFAKSTVRSFSDRGNTVGASEIGQCARKIFFAKNSDDRAYAISVDHDYVDSGGAALRGRLLEENYWLPALRMRFGDKLLYAGNEQSTLCAGFLSATPDGLLVEQPDDLLVDLGIASLAGDDSVVVECKSIDPRAQLDHCKPAHRFQTIVQLGLLRELTAHRPQYAVISYINASFPDDVEEFAVAFDEQTFATAKKRAATIMTATAADQLPPEGWIAGGRECKYCPFTKACGVMRHTVPTQPPIEAPDPQFVAEIADLARQAKEHETAADRATTRLRGLHTEIKDRLRAKRLRRINGDSVSVLWSPVKGRPAYDNKGIREAAAKAGVDLAQYETVGEPTDRLVIRVAERSRSAT